MTITKRIVDAPLDKSRYIKWLEEVLTLPEGKAVCVYGMTKRESLTLREAACRFGKFRTLLKPDGDQKTKLYVWRGNETG